MTPEQKIALMQLINESESAAKLSSQAFVSWINGVGEDKEIYENAKKEHSKAKDAIYKFLEAI